MTIYVHGLLRKVTKSGATTWRHRIEGPGGLLAIVNCNGTSCNPTVTTNYVHRDHLGSPELITNSSGIEVVKLSFGAFGERRDRDWHGPVSSADMTAIGNSTRRGFTEHEHLDSVGLVHMNGRVYDPVLGRFLSSDPIEDGLGRPGGFNRYAYVKNNPLTLIDPSGLSSKETKLPKHDAGQHGPLLEVIDVIAEHFWLPQGGTLAWTIVSAGSLGPALAVAPSFGGGGGGGGGSGGGGGGNDSKSPKQPSANGREPKERTKDKPECRFDATRAAQVRSSPGDSRNVAPGIYPSRTRGASGGVWIGTALEKRFLADFSTRTIHRLVSGGGHVGGEVGASFQASGGSGNRNFTTVLSGGAEGWGWNVSIAAVAGVGFVASWDGSSVTTSTAVGFEMGPSIGASYRSYEVAMPYESLPADMRSFYDDVWARNCGSR